MVLEEVGVFGGEASSLLPPPTRLNPASEILHISNTVEQKDDDNSDLQYSQIIVNLKTIDFKVNCDQIMTKHCTLWIPNRHNAGVLHKHLT